MYTKSHGMSIPLDKKMSLPYHICQEDIMIGAILREHRLKQGLKQYWVAEQAGLDVHTLMRLEQGSTRGSIRGRLNPSWETVGRIASVLGVRHPGPVP